MRLATCLGPQIGCSYVTRLLALFQQRNQISVQPTMATVQAPYKPAIPDETRYAGRANEEALLLFGKGKCAMRRDRATAAAE